jgi:hypothetical protein
MNRIGFELSTKSVDEAGRFEGLASVYHVTDLGGDIVEPGAFRRTLQEKGATRPLLWSHDAAVPIGTVRLMDSPEGLKVSGELDLDTQPGRDAYTRLKKGIVRGLSIGYKAVKERMESAARRLLDLDLYEVSLVTLPMNEMATVTRVKSSDTNIARGLESILHESGLTIRESKVASGAAAKALRDLYRDDDRHEEQLLAFFRDGG